MSGNPDIFVPKGRFGILLQQPRKKFIQLGCKSGALHLLDDLRREINTVILVESLSSLDRIIRPPFGNKSQKIVQFGL